MCTPGTGNLQILLKHHSLILIYLITVFPKGLLQKLLNVEFEAVVLTGAGEKVSRVTPCHFVFFFSSMFITFYICF